MKALKITLLVVLIFAAGFAAGVVTTRIAVRHFVQRAIAQPGLIRERVERNLDRRLSLDADQKKQVHDILVDTQSQIRTLREQARPQFTGILSNAEEQISAVLTPEQQKQFERYLAERRQILQPKEETHP